LAPAFGGASLRRRQPSGKTVGFLAPAVGGASRRTKRRKKSRKKEGKKDGKKEGAGRWILRSEGKNVCFFFSVNHFAAS
jgi:hypothetical protein